MTGLRPDDLSEFARLADDLDQRMAAADRRNAARPNRHTMGQDQAGHIMWALIRLLQASSYRYLITADDVFLDGRREELTEVVASQADAAMFSWLNPDRDSVRVVGQLAEATMVLQLLAPGPPSSKSRWNRVVAVEDAQGDWAWRSVVPWWQGFRRDPQIRLPGPRWVPWCDKIPAGPGGVSWTPAPFVPDPADRPEVVELRRAFHDRMAASPDPEEIAAGLASFYEQAFSSGRRWVCAHGWMHHPRTGDRLRSEHRPDDDPLSCHRRVREDAACDRCCATAQPYAKRPATRRGQPATR